MTNLLMNTNSIFACFQSCPTMKNIVVSSESVHIHATKWAVVSSRYSMFEILCVPFLQETSPQLQKFKHYWFSKGSLDCSELWMVFGTIIIYYSGIWWNIHNLLFIVSLNKKFLNNFFHRHVCVAVEVEVLIRSG